MSTKKVTTRYSETWQAKLGSGGVDGIDGTPIEGVRLGWCKYDGHHYKPVEAPSHVAEFLELRIVPADYLWPFYIDKDFGTVEQVIARAKSDSPGNFEVIEETESSCVVEFIVNYTNTVLLPVICEVDFDSAYCISGGDDNAEDAEWSDHVYFDAVCGLDGWFLSAVVDTLSSTDGLCTDDGPYASEDEAIYAGIDTALDWFYSSDIQPLYLDYSDHAELHKVIAAHNLQALFSDEREESDE